MQLLLLIFCLHISELCTVKLKAIVLKYKRELIGAGIGSVVGFLYWFFVGCESGSCAITSSPLNSAVYGAIMGALLAGIFEKETKTELNEKNK